MTRDRSGRAVFRRLSFQASIESLEIRQVLTSMFGLTSAGQLAAFDSARPSQVGSLTTVTGLKNGEALLGIDSRPATGQLFALGSTGRLYTINPLNGASSLVGAGPISAALSGTEFDIDFNPVSDVLRIVSDGGLDLRVNPDTAAVVVDANLAYAPTDIAAGTTAAVVGAAYTNNVSGAGSTTLFEIESHRDSLVTQGSVGGAPVSPNAGSLFTSSPLKLASNTAIDMLDAALGFEITPDGQALVSQTLADASATTLFSLDLNSGLLTTQGNFPVGLRIVDITTAMPGVVKLFAVTTSNRLILFRSDAPESLLSNQAILGIQPGETIQSVDVRPSTGQLYGFGSSGRLYVIDPVTGNASPVSSASISPAATGTKPSIDFDPVSGNIRLVTNAGQDLRLNPDTGAVVATDPDLAYGGGDPAAGIPPSVVAQGFTNSVFGATSTTLFGIDSARDTLILQGSPNGVPNSPNTGQLSTIGPLGRDITSNAGLDVSQTGRAFATLTDVGATTSALFIVNLSTGALTRIGTIGGSVVVADVAVASAGIVQFTAATYQVSADARSVTITTTRINGDTGAGQVRYTTSDVTARAGVNYSAVDGVLDFADGETTKTFTVPIRTGSVSSGFKTFRIVLSAAANGLVIGPIGTALVTIVAGEAVVSPGIQTATFRGSANAITAVDVTFRTSIDSSQAADVSNYLLRGVTAGRKPRTVTIAINSAVFDATTGMVHLVLNQSIALKTYRSLQVIAKGFGTDGFDVVAGYTIQRGSFVRFTDVDGDRVSLGVLGGNSKIVVVRRLNDGAIDAWVEGKGRVVFGSVIRTRRSNGRVVINRFVTSGARLRLPNSFQIDQVVTNG